MYLISRITKWYKIIDEFFFSDEEVGMYKVGFYSFMLGVPAFVGIVKMIQLFVS